MSTVHPHPLSPSYRAVTVKERYAILAAFLLLLSPLHSQSLPTIYPLGPDDQIMVKALDADEVTTAQPVRIDSRGNISLPLVGRTTDQLAAAIEQNLKRYLQSPDVSVYLIETHSQPISVLGYVTTPGVYQLQGHKTLYEVISMCGGIRQDAGYQIKLTRRIEWGRIPLPDAQDDPTGQFSIASVSIKGVMDATNPAENIEVRPNDVISVPKGEIVYVIGAVHKPGGFVIGEQKTISGLEVLSLAEGLDHFANSKKTKIMRLVANSNTRAEIPVDLKMMLDGKLPDVHLQAGDILYVPLSGRKAAAARGVEAALGLSTAVGSALVYRY